MNDTSTTTTSDAIQLLEQAQAAEVAAREHLETARAKLAALDAEVAAADPDARGFTALVARRTEAQAAVEAHQARVDRAAAELPPLAEAAHRAALRRQEEEVAALAGRMRTTITAMLDDLSAALVAFVPRRTELETLLTEGARLQRSYTESHHGEPHPGLHTALIVAPAWSFGAINTALYNLASAIERTRSDLGE